MDKTSGVTQMPVVEAAGGGKGCVCVCARTRACVCVLEERKRLFHIPMRTGKVEFSFR